MVSGSFTEDVALLPFSPPPLSGGGFNFSFTGEASLFSFSVTSSTKRHITGLVIKENTDRFRLTKIFSVKL